MSAVLSAARRPGAVAFYGLEPILGLGARIAKSKAMGHKFSDFMRELEEEARAEEHSPRV